MISTLSVYEYNRTTEKAALGQRRFASTDGYSFALVVVFFLSPRFSEVSAARL